MDKLFSQNLHNLRSVNIVVIVLASVWSFFPVFIEKNLPKAGIYLITALVSLVIVFITNYEIKRTRLGMDVTRKLTYILMTLYYSNVMFFGMYIGVWSNPEIFAVSFMSFLICALFLLINSPVYNLCLTLGALVIFIVSTVSFKSQQIWTFDLSNVLIAGCISLFFSWHITKLRLISALNTATLEDERNKYFNQSTIDELTGLRNRRDFMQTFHRYVSYYRSSDDWLCIAIADIDFFKNYNDYYGHPKGDECLRSVGNLLNSLRSVMSVYAARVGGEEFALLWFENKVEHVNTVVSGIFNLVRNLDILHEKSEASPHVTLSIGICVMRCGSFHDTHALYDSADKALYMAKKSGRNCAYINGRDIAQYKICGE